MLCAGSEGCVPSNVTGVQKLSRPRPSRKVPGGECYEAIKLGDGRGLCASVDRLRANGVECAGAASCRHPRSADGLAEASANRFPFPNCSLRPFPPLRSRLDTRPAIDILVDKVQKNLTAGQQEFKAGNTEKGRADLDNAVNLILLSGFQAESDPRLSKLFDQIGETVHAYQVTSGQVGEDEAEETETPAQPAPIDEIADLTLPAGDPRLALKAQKELITVPHDLPLTVNDSVLQYLSFFTTDARTGDRRARA